jgi:hypothetical protein
MSHRLSLSLVLVTLVFGGVARSESRPVALEGTSLVAEDKWVADEDDNICGIKDLKKISNPAKVDYDALLDATPQMKKIKEKKIDPESTEGKALRSEAKTLVTKSCELLRSSKGYCGVWKSIKNEDGRTVPDITDDVKAKIEE